MKIFVNINKFYLTNFLLVSVLLFSIVLAFFVQFKVEDVQDKIAFSESEIINAKDEINVLEAEWNYLTRPERLRVLAQRYLQNSNFIAVNQVKNFDNLKDYYFVKYQDFATQQVALNQITPQIIK